MRPTLEYVQTKFDEFNKLYFEGRLQPVPIAISMARGRLGCFSWRRDQAGKLYCSLRISARFDLSENHLENIIIHEMIHYYLLASNADDKVPHGPNFQKIMAEINRKSGRNITISYKATETEHASGLISEPAYICVTNLEGGELGITVCAKTRVFSINRAFKEAPLVKKLNWYWSTSPWFGRFPRVRTPKIYPLSQEEFSREFVSATPCEVVGKMFRVRKD